MEKIPPFVSFDDKNGETLKSKNHSAGVSETGILQVQDHPSPYRKWILRWMFRNYPELLRFYLFGARLARVPIIGPLLARPILSEYGFIAHGGIALPLSAINKVIDQARDIVAGECPCRALVNNCDLPRHNCLKLNTAGEVLLDESKGRRLSREEAKEIVARSYANGMLLQLEWCINPYHYDICSCCECCCVARRLRFEYGIKGAIQAGPYIPEFSPDSCIQCMECADICPANAITCSSGPSVDSNKCVGCGLCESICPAEAIEIKAKRAVKRKSPPSAFQIFLWWVTAVLFLMPEVMLFKVLPRRDKSSG
jgi:formate hydrogenlyase subunit 6/NADH:ubiquinone oxidoreductase subunit I